MRGKDFENEVGKSLLALNKTQGLEHWNNNNPIPLCDFTVWYRGRYWLIEAKETHSDRFSFSQITDTERKALDRIHRANHEGWVIIKRIEGAKARAFAINWADWLELEFGFGYQPNARNKRGSGSFPLMPDDLRPGFFRELARVRRLDPDGNNLGMHWDLDPLFNQEVSA